MNTAVDLDVKPALKLKATIENTGIIDGWSMSRHSPRQEYPKNLNSYYCFWILFRISITKRIY